MNLNFFSIFFGGRCIGLIQYFSFSTVAPSVLLSFVLKQYIVANIVTMLQYIVSPSRIVYCAKHLKLPYF